MTMMGAMTQVAWLQNNYPRQYPDTMPGERITLMVNQYLEIFPEYSDEDVMEVYTEFIKESRFPPAINEVIDRLKRNESRKAAVIEREISKKIIERETYKRPDDIIVVNGVRVRMLNREAVRHFMEDLAAGGTKGGGDYYFRRYPKVEFVPLGTDLRSTQ